MDDERILATLLPPVLTPVCLPKASEKTANCGLLQGDPLDNGPYPNIDDNISNINRYPLFDILTWTL